MVYLQPLDVFAYKTNSSSLFADISTNECAIKAFNVYTDESLQKVRVFAEKFILNHPYDNWFDIDQKPLSFALDITPMTSTDLGLLVDFLLKRLQGVQIKKAPSYPIETSI